MLRYIGNAVLVGIPARDLADEEVELYGGEKALLDSGLYEKVKAQPAPISKPQKVEILEEESGE